MDNKDGRRPRVPAGTFGGSDPPPDADETTIPGEEGDEPTRPGLRRAISGQPPPVPPRRPSAETAEERRQRHVSTLVGHPTGASVPPPVPGQAPMLAPPKWTGASAYVEGQEPQPRVSALPAPQHVPLPPVANAEPSRSRITTKVGHVQVQPQPPPPPPGESGAPAIGDAIQEMLDSQAAVPMEMQQHEEQRASGADEELPIDELQIEEILDGLSEAKPPAHEVYGRERGDEPTLQHAAPPPPDGPRMAPAAAINPHAFATHPHALGNEYDRDVEPPRAPPAQVPEPPRAPPPAPPTPRAVAPVAAQPPAVEPTPAREPVKDSARPRRPAVEGMRPELASSLAPSEVRRRPRYRDDSQTGVGVLLLAAMAVIGVGGWYLTKGKYPGARPRPAQASAAVETTPAVKGPPAKVASPTAAPATAPGPAAPAVAVDQAPPSSQDTVKRAESKARPAKVPQPAPRVDSDRAVVKVTPKPEPGEPGAMLDIPSRDNVVAALTPLRAAVVECAHGQRGVAQLDITVASTGVVTNAVVGGDFAGTSEGSCIARVARSASFVPFKKPRFRVIYPFSL